MNAGESLIDVLDDFTKRYPDAGCEVSTHCLDCPLPRCKHDDPAGFRAWKMREEHRDRIAMLYRSNSASEAARRLGCSVRSVHRSAALVRAGLLS